MVIVRIIFQWKVLKWALLLLSIFLLVSCWLIWWANRSAVNAAEGRLYDDVADIPKELSEDRVALVLGCSKKIGDRDNLYFKYRIDAAVALWKRGQIRGFIVSGDNGTADYNEPEDMKQSLIEQGVPENNIVCDYAGFRTLDSIVRVKEVFGQTKVVVISQKFHNERAAYLAKEQGIDMIGLNAQSVGGRSKKKNNRREYLARVKMMIDIKFGKDPKFLGKMEQLGF